ncbi:unnamed protein product [Pedinophyceae sp. YPF-701]|nr:unnamed protein product [Pedinophyceae sp. YPF-701]
MEALLTPLFAHVLGRFVKESKEGTGADGLRARLSGGSLVLHNLDLDLQHLVPPSLPFIISRATCSELRVEVPWTALHSRPLKVVVRGLQVEAEIGSAGGGTQRKQRPVGSDQAPAAPAAQLRSLLSTLEVVLESATLTLRSAGAELTVLLHHAQLCRGSPAQPPDDVGFEAPPVGPGSDIVHAALSVSRVALHVSEPRTADRVTSRRRICNALVQLEAVECAASVPIQLYDEREWEVEVEDDAGGAQERTEAEQHVVVVCAGARAVTIACTPRQIALLDGMRREWRAAGVSGAGRDVGADEERAAPSATSPGVEARVVENATALAGQQDARADATAPARASWYSSAWSFVAGTRYAGESAEEVPKLSPEPASTESSPRRRAAAGLRLLRPSRVFVFSSVTTLEALFAYDGPQVPAEEGQDPEGTPPQGLHLLAVVEATTAETWVSTVSMAPRSVGLRCGRLLVHRMVKETAGGWTAGDGRALPDGLLLVRTLPTPCLSDPTGMTLMPPLAHARGLMAPVLSMHAASEGKFACVMRASMPDGEGQLRVVPDAVEMQLGMVLAAANPGLLRDAQIFVREAGFLAEQHGTGEAGAPSRAAASTVTLTCALLEVSLLSDDGKRPSALTVQTTNSMASMRGRDVRVEARVAQAWAQPPADACRPLQVSIPFGPGKGAGRDKAATPGAPSPLALLHDPVTLRYERTAYVAEISASEVRLHVPSGAPPAVEAAVLGFQAGASGHPVSAMVVDAQGVSDGPDEASRGECVEVVLGQLVARQDAGRLQFQPVTARISAHGGQSAHLTVGIDHAIVDTAERLELRCAMLEVSADDRAWLRANNFSATLSSEHSPEGFRELQAVSIERVDFAWTSQCAADVDTLLQAMRVVRGSPRQQRMVASKPDVCAALISGGKCSTSTSIAIAAIEGSIQLRSDCPVSFGGVNVSMHRNVSPRSDPAAQPDQDPSSISSFVLDVEVDDSLTAAVTQTFSIGRTHPLLKLCIDPAADGDDAAQSTLPPLAVSVTKSSRGNAVGSYSALQGATQDVSAHCGRVLAALGPQELAMDLPALIPDALLAAPPHTAGPSGAGTRACVHLRQLSAELLGEWGAVQLSAHACRVSAVFGGARWRDDDCVDVAREASFAPASDAVFWRVVAAKDDALRFAGRPGLAWGVRTSLPGLLLHGRPHVDDAPSDGPVRVDEAVLLPAPCDAVFSAASVGSSLEAELSMSNWSYTLAPAIVATLWRQLKGFLSLKDGLRPAGEERDDAARAPVRDDLGSGAFVRSNCAADVSAECQCVLDDEAGRQVAWTYDQPRPVHALAVDARAGDVRLESWSVVASDDLDDTDGRWETVPLSRSESEGCFRVANARPAERWRVSWAGDIEAQDVRSTLVVNPDTDSSAALPPLTPSMRVGFNTQHFAVRLAADDRDGVPGEFAVLRGSDMRTSFASWPVNRRAGAAAIEATAAADLEASVIGADGLPELLVQQAKVRADFCMNDHAPAGGDLSETSTGGRGQRPWHTCPRDAALLGKTLRLAADEDFVVFANAHILRALRRALRVVPAWSAGMMAVFAQGAEARPESVSEAQQGAPAVAELVCTVENRCEYDVQVAQAGAPGHATTIPSETTVPFLWRFSPWAAPQAQRSILVRLTSSSSTRDAAGQWQACSAVLPDDQHLRGWSRGVSLVKAGSRVLDAPLLRPTEQIATARVVVVVATQPNEGRTTIQIMPAVEVVNATSHPVPASLLHPGQAARAQNAKARAVSTALTLEPGGPFGGAAATSVLPLSLAGEAGACSELVVAGAVVSLDAKRLEAAQPQLVCIPASNDCQAPAVLAVAAGRHAGVLVVALIPALTLRNLCPTSLLLRPGLAPAAMWGMRSAPLSEEELSRAPCIAVSPGSTTQWSPTFAGDVPTPHALASRLELRLRLPSGDAAADGRHGAAWSGGLSPQSVAASGDAVLCSLRLPDDEGPGDRSLPFQISVGALAAGFPAFQIVVAPVATFCDFTGLRLHLAADAAVGQPLPRLPCKVAETVDLPLRGKLAQARPLACVVGIPALLQQGGRMDLTVAARAPGHLLGRASLAVGSGALVRLRSAESGDGRPMRDGETSSLADDPGRGAAALVAVQVHESTAPSAQLVFWDALGARPLTPEAAMAAGPRWAAVSASPAVCVVNHWYHPLCFRVTSKLGVVVEADVAANGPTWVALEDVAAEGTLELEGRFGVERAGAAWGAAFPLLQPTTVRGFLPGAGGEPPRSLAKVVVAREGGQIIVSVAPDADPPVVIENRTGSNMRAALSFPQRRDGGQHSFAPPKTVVHLPHGSITDADWSSDAPGTAQGPLDSQRVMFFSPDHAQLLDRLGDAVHRRGRIVRPPPAMLLLLEAGDGDGELEEWAEAAGVPCTPGTYNLAGGRRCRVAWVGASLCVTILDAGTDVAPQVDRRRRQLRVSAQAGRRAQVVLLGGSVLKDRKPGGCPYQEIACLTLLKPSATLFAGPEASDCTDTVSTKIDVAGAGLQVDNLLAGLDGEQVMLSTSSAGREPRPVLLRLHVARGAVAPWRQERTWVRLVSSSTPPLAVKLDDSLRQLMSAVEAQDLLSCALVPPQSAAAPTDPPSDAARVDPGVLAATELEHMYVRVVEDAQREFLLVEQFAIAPLHMSLSAQLSAPLSGALGALPLGTRDAPAFMPALRLGATAGPRHVLQSALLAHLTAEAMLNAPSVVGGLELLLNPGGVAASLRRGLNDLIAMPMDGMERGSAAGFLAGLGQGSLSLIRQVSGSTVLSVSGFSSAVSRAISRAQEQPEAPAHDDEHDVLAGPTFLGSIGRGLLQTATAPISGTLGLIGWGGNRVAAALGVIHSVAPQAGAWQRCSGWCPPCSAVQMLVANAAFCALGATPAGQAAAPMVVEGVAYRCAAAHVHLRKGGEFRHLGEDGWRMRGSGATLLIAASGVCLIEGGAGGRCLAVAHPDIAGFEVLEDGKVLAAFAHCAVLLGAVGESSDGGRTPVGDVGSVVSETHTVQGAKIVLELPRPHGDAIAREVEEHLR